MCTAKCGTCSKINWIMLPEWKRSHTVSMFQRASDTELAGLYHNYIWRSPECITPFLSLNIYEKVFRTWHPVPCDNAMTKICSLYNMRSIVVYHLGIPKSKASQRNVPWQFQGWICFTETFLLCSKVKHIKTGHIKRFRLRFYIGAKWAWNFAIWLRCLAQ